MRTCLCGRNMAVTSQREITPFENNLFRPSFEYNSENNLYKFYRFPRGFAFFDVGLDDSFFDLVFVGETCAEGRNSFCNFIQKIEIYSIKENEEVPGAKCLSGGGGSWGKICLEGKRKHFFCRNGI